MRDTLINMITDLTTNARVAQGVTTFTFGSVITYVMEIFPDFVSVVAASAAAVLSIVLIRSHLIKTKRDTERHKLEMKLLRKQLADKEDKEGKL